MDEATARLALVAAMHELDARGLNHGSSGNASIRVDDRLIVTPTGIPSAVLTAADMVLIDLDGRPGRPGQRRPTSEWPLHVRLARARPDATAIVHTHSPEATAASTLRRPVPAVHYVVARFGATELPCAPYATYGTDELADHVVGTLGDRGTACLMANHGAIAIGPDLGAALALAVEVEWLCGVARRARQLGEPVALDAAEIERVAERLATYGQPEGAPP
jgi:L-fuculose-phosphate aldolase